VVYEGVGSGKADYVCEWLGLNWRRRGCLQVLRVRGTGSGVMGPMDAAGAGEAGGGRKEMVAGLATDGPAFPAGVLSVCLCMSKP